MILISFGCQNTGQQKYSEVASGTFVFPQMLLIELIFLVFLLEQITLCFVFYFLFMSVCCCSSQNSTLCLNKSTYERACEKVQRREIHQSYLYHLHSQLPR